MTVVKAHALNNGSAFRKNLCCLLINGTHCVLLHLHDYISFKKHGYAVQVYQSFKKRGNL